MAVDNSLPQMKNNIILAYITIVAFLLALSSCSQSAEPEFVTESQDNVIVFNPSLSAASGSRAEPVVGETLSEFKVTSFFPDGRFYTGDLLNPYFEGVTFTKTADGKTFADASELARWPLVPGIVKFLAYYPVNYSFTNASLWDKIVYEIPEYHINPDISQQVDFIAAYAATTKCVSVPLIFKHQLSRIELKAKSQNKDYNFKVAGVRIGNQVSTATFMFAEDSQQPGDWSNKVTLRSGVSYTYLRPDAVKDLVADESDIMGDGGSAMVIPVTATAWDTRKEWGDEGGKMYLSVLLRVTRADGSLFYPYQKNEHPGMRVEHVVDKDGKPCLDSKGQPLDFGWAAIPISVDWKPGKHYIYTIDYSHGIGFHDPDDPNPGHPIEEGSVGVSVSVRDWEDPTPASYNPDIPVPYE